MHFWEKLMHIKYKMEDFKTVLLKILKQQDEKLRNYEQRLEKTWRIICRTKTENVNE